MRPATSARDPRVVRAARLLRDADARREEGAFVVDEPALLEEALDAGIDVEWVLGEWDGGGRAGGAPEVAAASADALRAVAAVGQPPSVVAICRIPPAPPPALPPRSLVLAHVADDGNVGSIVRTAAAFGLPRVALTPGCADPWSRRALRAARGATFRRGLVAEGARLEGGRLFAAVPRGGVDPRELPEDACVVLGSERDGLRDDEREACVGAVSIPAPHFESLNVAAAAAILTYALARGA
ncbi:MAG TPA: TrmH family RNA methyltransferase [Solirubrobacteraceae bacterium]|jgi:TrmH family RNA methyltransferase